MGAWVKRVGCHVNRGFGVALAAFIVYNIRTG